MKCPKCGYLGFEHVDRCRNCGYEFALAQVTLAAPELPIRTQQATVDLLRDLALLDEPSRPPRSLSPAEVGRNLDRMADAVGTAHVELPLFGPPIDDDVPLITKASPPRAPLAVRRATPEVPRVRGDDTRAQALDLRLELDSDASPGRSASEAARAGAAARMLDEAGYVARLVAVAIDVLLLGAVDAAVVYFTLQICGLTIHDVRRLPLGPLVAFLFVQNGGYLVAFTAGGQTLGKMCAGIRVVAADSDGSLDLGRAFVRTIIWFLLALPAGLGLLTAIFSRDRRGLHDRCAGTRVVRVAA